MIKPIILTVFYYLQIIGVIICFTYLKTVEDIVLGIVTYLIVGGLLNSILFNIICDCNGDIHYYRMLEWHKNVYYFLKNFFKTVFL